MWERLTYIYSINSNQPKGAKKLNTMATHKQTVYIVQDNSGKLHIVQYAPSMSYSGRRDSDQYALMQGLFIDEISHDLWLGEVVCHLNVHTPSGIQTQINITCKIVAKESFLWDMSAPMGSRKSEVKSTSNYIALVKSIVK